MIDRRTLMIGTAAVSAATALPLTRPAKAATAPLTPTPPMGWNSWNSFATTITEPQVLETARIMAEKLKPSGYDILTVDIQWYEPNASSYAYAAKPTPTLDGHGRLLPAPNRFPSSANGRGFAPLADQVHALGLRFGIHLMRGIPRLAVERNLPILGTRFTARDVANTASICPWNPDMYGVDMTRPGAQAYYDSVFALYASWGVDFVKMDDMSRPYDSHAPEIEAAHNAIMRTGRPMLLSLSPGETPVARADHVRRHAQMWRISDDFWDEWPLLEAQFTRLANWNEHRIIGGWPDADMLPLGRIALGERDTKFTPDEQRTVMTLWSIARSPLIMGGDLRHLDTPTLTLLTNPEVIAVNQRSSDNRPHFLMDDTPVWSAKGPDGMTWLAVFNTAAKPRQIGIDLREIGISGQVQARDCWARTDQGIVTNRFEQRVPSHGAMLTAFRT